HRSLGLCLCCGSSSSASSAKSTSATATTPAAPESGSRLRRGPGIGIPWQAFFQLLPGCSRIGGLVEPAVGATAVKTECGTTALVGGGDDRSWTLIVQRDIRHDRIFINE